MKQLRTDVQKDYSEIKKKELESGPKASYGYGGKFGVQKDRMDQVLPFTVPLHSVCLVICAGNRARISLLIVSLVKPIKH